MDISPREVYDEPSKYISLLTLEDDGDLEDQYIDRKEIPGQKNGEIKQKFREEKIIKTISAFANTNECGGLLVLGIDSNGNIKGTNHITNKKSKTSLYEISNQLVHTRIKLKEIDIDKKTIILIYVYYAKAGLSLTVKGKKGWIREGSNCIPLSEDTKSKLIEERKRKEHYEICCLYRKNDLDEEIFNFFKDNYLKNISHRSDDDILEEEGIVRKVDGQLFFTEQGYLFFAKNPEKEFPLCFTRVIRYSETLEEYDVDDTTLDRKCRGNVISQIRQAQKLLRDSAVIGTYQGRDDDGEPVTRDFYPKEVLEEAIVNAIAHRVYSRNSYVTCSIYKDCLVVENPGLLPQAEGPMKFDLSEKRLHKHWRNDRIMRWLELCKKENGKGFVFMKNEGTRIMVRAMEEYGLPSPSYELSLFTTKLILKNGYSKRKKQTPEQKAIPVKIETPSIKVETVPMRKRYLISGIAIVMLFLFLIGYMVSLFNQQFQEKQKLLTLIESITAKLDLTTKQLNKKTKSEQSKIDFFTARPDGSYFNIGGSISENFNENNSNWRFAVIPTKGSKINLKLVAQSNKACFALVQSDILAPQSFSIENVRSVLQLYEEHLVIIGKKGIDEFKHINGKKVFIGEIGSGTRESVTELFKFHNIEIAEDKIPGNTSDLPLSFASGDIDIICYMIKHPTPVIDKILKEGGVPITIPLLDEFEQSRPYKKTKFPTELYDLEGSKEIETIAVRTVLITNEFASDKLIEEIINIIMKNKHLILKTEFRNTKVGLYKHKNIKIHKHAKKLLEPK